MTVGTTFPTKTLLTYLGEGLVSPHYNILHCGLFFNSKYLYPSWQGNIGTGILAMPYAFKNAGLWLGFFATLIIGLSLARSMPW